MLQTRVDFKAREKCLEYCVHGQRIYHPREKQGITVTPASRKAANVLRMHFAISHPLPDSEYRDFDKYFIRSPTRKTNVNNSNHAEGVNTLPILN
jgi:hypothetical protein